METIPKIFKTNKLNSRQEIVLAARKGIQADIFFSFSKKIGLSENHVAQWLHLHPRTINNYAENKKVLNPVESEHLLKLIALYAKGEEVLGSVNQFNQWLISPSWMSNDKPSDWLFTPGGVDFVSDELDRMAFGYPV